MNTLADIEKAILKLSRVEIEALSGWLAELMKSPGGVEESRAKYVVERELPETIEEYMAYEADSRIRHEYLAGEIFAMSGASLRHTRLVRRIVEAISSHLRGGPCEVYFQDTKLKLRVNLDNYVYYPDVLVVCDRDRSEERFVTDPKLVMEVLSDSTANVDRREKRYNYTWIPALEEYVIVAQNVPEVTVFRRAEGWKPVVLDSLEATLELRSIGLALPLARVYEGERSSRAE